MHGTTHVIFQYKNPDEDPTPTVSLPLPKTCQPALESFQPFQTKESHLCLKDLQKSHSLVGVETEPKLPVCLAEPLDHLSILWHLVHSCPAVLVEDLTPSCTASTWSSFQEFLIPDTTPATLVSYGPFFPKSPTNPYVFCKQVLGTT